MQRRPDLWSAPRDQLLHDEAVDRPHDDSGVACRIQGSGAREHVRGNFNIVSAHLVAISRSAGRLAARSHNAYAPSRYP